MRRQIMTALGVLGGVAALLCVPGLAAAQDWIQLRGRLQSVDCGTGTLILRTQAGNQVVPVAPDALVRLNTFPVAVCALRPFAGSAAFAWLTPRGSRPVAVRVEVFSAASVVAPPPAYYPCCPFYPGFVGFPGIGIGIGVGFGPRYGPP